MASGMSGDPYAPQRVIQGTAAKLMQRVASLGMSPRQQELNRLYSFYSACQYDARRCDWDGKEVLDPIDHESIARAGYIPPGFYDGGATLPLKFRRPYAPYHLARAITERFTGLLFSERRHPQLKVLGDPDTEDFISALAEESSLWATMMLIRSLGGAMGTIVVGFKFIDGKPRLEPHDPRWVRPVFADRETLKLKAIDKRYMYPVEDQNSEGGWETLWYWHRRLIDDTRDVVFKPVQVDEGQEPLWVEDPDLTVEHNLGFCPAVWVQNIPVLDDVYGEPDCHGVYDQIESMDRLLSQAQRGIIRNCDPTVFVATDDKIEGGLMKGSDNAIYLSKGSSADYMEAAMTGPEAAQEMADGTRAKILEIAQCVLDTPDDSTQKTATEVRNDSEAMHSKADKFREQYGKRCIKPLLEMMVAAAAKVNVQLPPKVTVKDKQTETKQRKLGKSNNVQIHWGPYTDTSPQDALQSVQTAAAAYAAKIIDLEHAVRFIAPYFRVEDISVLVKKIEEEAKKQQAQMGNDMMSRMQQAGGGQQSNPRDINPFGEAADKDSISID